VVRESKLTAPFGILPEIIGNAYRSALAVPKAEHETQVQPKRLKPDELSQEVGRMEFLNAGLNAAGYVRGLAKCDLHELGWQNAKAERNRKLKVVRPLWQDARIEMVALLTPSERASAVSLPTPGEPAND
jgi:hypothetical protein